MQRGQSCDDDGLGYDGRFDDDDDRGSDRFAFVDVACEINRLSLMFVVAMFHIFRFIF